MRADYTAIVFGRKDGSIINQETFWLEHPDIYLTSRQKIRLLDNVERQAIQFLEKNWRLSHEEVKIDKMCASFTFCDPRTGELFFTPLFEIDVCVVFRKMNQAYLLIYDLRRVPVN